MAILAPDGVEHIDCFDACSRIGAIHVPLNWRLHARELGELLGRVRPRVLLWSAEFGDVVESLRSERGEIRHWLEIGAELDAIVEDEQIEVEPPTALEPEEIAALIFTGGTTGFPKGAMVSHRMVAYNTLDTAIHDLRPGDIYLDVFPLFHTGGLLVYTLPQLILGGTTILMPRFDPDRALEIIDRERVSVFAAVPTMYQRLTTCEGWSTARLDSLRYCSSGGAPLPVQLIEQFHRDKGVRFKQGFGMSEFGPGAFSLPPEDAIRKAGSVGKPEYFVEARICDSDGAPVGVGTVGELWLRGPVACSGYFEPEGPPAPALDDEGWFHTGDLAHCDEDGYYYVAGRLKDMYISGGENVYPVEVEEALYEHPAVASCAVIGVADPEWGQVGLACVVLREGHASGAEQLIEHLRERLAGFKIPRRFEFLETLPLSGPGKVLKRELRKRFGT